MIYPQIHTKTFQIVVILLGTLLCLHLGSDGSASQDPQPPWVYNYPSTPLQITAIGKRVFELTNLGRSRIVVYRLGCVTIRESHPSIVSTESRESADIAVSDKIEKLAMHVLQDRLKCIQENAKLSVVWVQFDDDAEWTAPRVAQK
jgi:hypothetical protein